MPHVEQAGGPFAAEEDIDFFLKLEHKFFKEQSTDLASLQSALTATGGSISQFDALLVAYGSKVTDPADRKVFPRTWDDFYTHVLQDGFGQTPGDPRNNALFQAFFVEYLDILKVTSGDWSGVDVSTLQDQFVEAFNEFLDGYHFLSNPGQPDDGAAGDTTFFLTNFTEFMTLTGVHRTDLVTGNISAYEQIFKAFFPAGTEEQFVALRNSLIEEFREDSDYYLPSHAMRKWYDKVQQEYLATQLGANSVKGTEGVRLVIIWRLFNLVVEMIGTIQKVGSVLADRLGFLTRYQKAYTELMADVPVFTKGDDSPFGGEDDDSAEARQELNPKNQTLTENLRSFRSIISDEAKALQSNVNQVNESVNQQSNLATAILQQMSTILQAIYR